MQGTFKKVLIANNVGALWELIRVLPGAQASVATAWLGAAAFTLQLYFDFSAYSDMAIGMGQMLDFIIWKILIIHCTPYRSQIFGEDGIYHSLPESGIISIFRLAEIERVCGSI